jgi:tRNA (guanine-N7-)-methyltransferase
LHADAKAELSLSDAADHPRALHGRRKGRPLRRQRAGLIETLLPGLALPLHRPAPNPLTALFSPPVRAVRMEIGFGGGEHLTAAAQMLPETGFIGCEPFLNGMARALSLIETKRLANIRLHFGDAAEVIGWLPSAALARVDLLYPDPWPKRRHWKRRFIQDESVAAVARVLAPGGELRFATDWPDYAAWTLERLLRSPHFVWTAERADDWRLPWPGYTRTRYEEKAIRAGRQPCYLAFRRTA